VWISVPSSDVALRRNLISDKTGRTVFAAIEGYGDNFVVTDNIIDDGYDNGIAYPQGGEKDHTFVARNKILSAADDRALSISQITFGYFFQNEFSHGVQHGVRMNIPNSFLVFDENIISNNATGFDRFNSDFLTIINNRIVNNTTSVTGIGGAPPPNLQWTNNTVIDNGADTVWSSSGYNNATPTAQIVSVDTAAVGVAVNFSVNFNDTDGSLDAVLWDFDHGIPDTNAVTTHSFDGAGNYKVSLVAWDDFGRGVLDTKIVTVVVTTTTLGTSTTSTTSTSSTSTTGPYDAACVHYPVETYGGTQSDTVIDESINGQDGIADGAVFPLGTTPGLIGNSAIFPGGGDIYVAGEVPPSGNRFRNQSLNLGGSDYTLMMWVRATDAYDNAAGADGLVFNPPTMNLFLSKIGKIQFEVPGDSATMASTGGTAIPVDSQWYHVAVVVNRDNIGGNPSAIYLNSADVTGSDTLENTLSSLTPGPNEFWLWGRALTGQGDDFAIFKESLSQTQVSDLNGVTTTDSTTTSTSSTLSPPVDLTDACLYYPLEVYGGTMTDTVADASGNGQDGIADGAVYGAGQPVPGRNGNSAVFPGGGDIYVAGETPPSSTRYQNTTLELGTNDFTIVMWVRATGAYSPMGGINGLLFGTPKFQLYLSKNGEVEFEVPGDGATMTTTNGSAIPVDSQWYHVAAVVNRDNTGGNPSAIYINSIDATGADTMENTPTSLSLGINEFWTLGRTLTGQGDDFAIFKESLSQFQVGVLGGFITTTSSTTLSTSTTISTTTSTTTTTTTTSTSTSSTTSPFGGSHNVSFTYSTGGYFSFEVGDIDPGLAFGHGFLTPGSGDGARFDFWFAPDGVVDGSGVDGGGGATPGGNYATGGDDVFMGARSVNEDGVDQYMGGAGLDIDSFASLAVPLTNYTGPGFADGTVSAYGRVFENDSPQVGDWYYVSQSEVIRNQDVPANPPNSIAIGRGLGLAGLDPIDGTQWSFQVAASVPPPVIADVNTDVTLWAVYTPTGMITPMYSTNLGTVPIEWIPISVFSNSFVTGTNVIEFDPPNTNATALFFHLLQTF